MFGYVTPLKPELKIKDFTKFRSYYCGLCFHLKSNFGNIPRTTLNYDMTFLGILLDSICPDKTSFEKKRCIAHPFENKPVVVNNKALTYASIISMSLFYFKVLDDVHDEGKLKSKLLATILLPYKKKSTNNIKSINEIIKNNLNDLALMEKNSKFEYIDEIAHPFSDIVGNILSMYPNEINDDNPTTRKTLYNLGYSLGKWIYIIDAFDDLYDDMQKNKFNPINILYNKNNLSYNELLILIKEKIEFILFNCSYNCKECLESLPIKENKDILFNILELGMMDKYLSILNKSKCKNK